MRRTFFLLRALVMCALPLCFQLLACASTASRGAPQTVDDMYAQAMDDLKNSLYPEALDSFETIKARYPYSKYAALSDLRIADTHYERQSYVEAIDAYRSFLKYHPTHSEAPYAMFRIAEAYEQQIPTDFFILPPSQEKDQASTRLSISAYRDMLNRYPTSEYAEKAQAKLDNCRRRLGEHEMYVARFYFKREKYLASAMRAEGVLKDYPNLGLDAEALYIAGSSRFYAKEFPLARTHLAKLESDFKESDEADKARSVIEEMNKASVPEAKADGDAPATSDVSSPAPSATSAGSSQGSPPEEAPVESDAPKPRAQNSHGTRAEEKRLASYGQRVEGVTSRAS